MKKLITLALFIILIFISGFFIAKQTILKSKVVHYHAGFQVYINGKLQDYSGWQYMHQEPCSLNGKPVASKDEQIEKAHLHERVGDVVHVHRTGVIWQDLLTNIKVAIPNDAIGYINGQKGDNFLQVPILPYDSLVVVIGNNNDIQKELAGKVTKAHIQLIEKTSEQCGS